MTLEGLNEDFRDVLVQFADAGVEFVVVGAYALAFHGAPRASGDIDLFIRPSVENARRVHEALARFGAPLAASGVTPDDFARPGVVYQIGLPPRRIDVMTQISGVAFDEAWESRVPAEVDGRTIGFIGRAALLKNKHAAGRLKDLADAARLRELSGES
ncbi:MAG: nucleotidyl transferase AbiEii/AbiGii toxin family protein [Candidatus Rokubacteria bacterium]|nr:nucleotidyl transferase AbiEii/AbiGii toxin family protein [Candidatus Rokubacteria bacterium]